MAIIVGNINCAENYQQVAVMGSSVGDPIPDGVGCLSENDFDTVDAASVALFYEPALEASSPNDAPSNYFNDGFTNSSNELITIPMNNFFDDHRQIFSASLTSLPYDKAATELTKLANKAARQNAKVELACLAIEGTVVEGTEITKDNIRDVILDDLSAIRNTGANPTIAICTPDFYAKLVVAAGESLKQVESNERWINAQVGNFLGVLWVTSPLLADASAKYYNNAGSLEGADFEGIEYIMWDGSKFAAIERITEFSIKDGGVQRAQISPQAGGVVQERAGGAGVEEDTPAPGLHQQGQAEFTGQLRPLRAVFNERGHFDVHKEPSQCTK